MKNAIRLALLLLCLHAAVVFADTVPASLPLPLDGRAWIEPGNVLLHWTAPIGNPAPIDHYTVLLDEDPDVIADPNGEAAYGGNAPATAAPSFAVGALEGNTVYYWRVDTVLTDETVVQGPSWFFATEAVDIPGTVVDYSPDPATVYLMSPSIAKLPDGTILATHDISGEGAPSPSNTVVLASYDDGVNWEQIAVVSPLHWATLFRHEGALYLFGDSGGGSNSHCVIHRSEDDGYTWTEALDENSGILFPDNAYHTGPVPVIVHNGRIWRTMEDRQDPGDWPFYFRAFVMSAPVDADLLVAANWTATNRLSYDEETWPGTGWLEGNAVVTPQGEVVNILRVADLVPTLGVVETGAMVHISEDGTVAEFDPESDFIDFPGGGVKFTIRYDETSGRYWSLVNKQRDPWALRNRLALVSSPDLFDWTVHDEILTHWDPVFHAWQYIDWVFDGNDILFLSRTAFPMGDGVLPHGYHDANFSTFHRIENFRDYLNPVDDDVVDDDVVDDDVIDDDAVDDDIIDDDAVDDDAVDDDIVDDDTADDDVADDDGVDDDSADDDLMDDDASGDDDDDNDDDGCGLW